MKTWIGSAIAALVGLAFGLGLTQFEFAGMGEYLRVSNTSIPPIRDEEDPEADPGEPVAELPRVKLIGEPIFEFGTIEQNTSGSHVFQLANEGKAPLKLVITGTTCKCTVGKLETNVVPPGETADIELTYKAEQPTPNYHHGATIRTNDPKRPTIALSVKGVVENRVFVLPPTLVLSRISANSLTEFQVAVYSVRYPDFEVTEAVFTEQESAKFFEVAITPLPAEWLEGQRSADGGRLLTIHTKPGLPNGPFHQNLQVSTNSSQPIDIPISGSVIADVSIVGGQKFHSDAGLFDMGVIESKQGASERLLVLVKGKNRDKIKIGVASSSPSMLKVELGEPTRGAKVTRYPLILTIEPGSPSGSFLGSQSAGFGSVVLETDDPRNKRVSIRVRFAVK